MPSNKVKGQIMSRNDDRVSASQKSLPLLLNLNRLNLALLLSIIRNNYGNVVDEILNHWAHAMPRQR